MALAGMEPDYAAYRDMLNALGHAGQLDAMRELLDTILAATPEDAAAELLDVLADCIFHFGRHREIDRAMEVYDRLLERSLHPNERLNRILIHTCKVDALSVAWNARE